MMSRDCVLLRALGRDRRNRGGKALAYFSDHNDGLVVVVVVSIALLLLLLLGVFSPPWLLGVERRVLNTSKKNDVSLLLSRTKSRKKKFQKKEKKKIEKKCKKKEKISKKRKKNRVRLLLSRLLLLLLPLSLLRHNTKNISRSILPTTFVF